MKTKIIAIDFDGTLCDGAFPGIGAPHMNTINKAKEEQIKGAKLILWTVRSGKYLEDAIEWCKQFDLHFDAINDNVDIIKQDPDFQSPKVLATEYWDDRAIICANDTINSAAILSDKLIRELSCNIIDAFEEMLDRYNIDIPDEYRNSNENEAHIYGNNYYFLEDHIVSLLKTHIGVKDA